MRIRVYTNGDWVCADDADRDEEACVNAPSDDYATLVVPDGYEPKDIDSFVAEWEAGTTLRKMNYFTVRWTGLHAGVVPDGCKMVQQKRGNGYCWDLVETTMSYDEVCDILKECEATVSVRHNYGKAVAA